MTNLALFVLIGPDPYGALGETVFPLTTRLTKTTIPTGLVQSWQVLAYV